jgi:hypothetical protein
VRGVRERGGVRGYLGSFHSGLRSMSKRARDVKAVAASRVLPMAM